jgi:MFS superfamily sulfate permease-like transporter
MKVLAVVAIAQNWTPSMIYASGFGMGVIWIIFAVTGLVEWMSKITPSSVIRGIQAALGVLLAIEAVKLMSGGWVLGIVAIVIVLLLRDNRYAPAAVVLMLLGMVVVYATGQLQNISSPGFSLPPITTFTVREVWDTLLLAGFAQIPLTITNATIATAALISTYWPDKPVTARKLSWNQGIMNTVLPSFGGMPMCHGAGGLAGQYYFGARTGGTNIIEGVIEISLGLFLSASIAGLFSVFPSSIVGAMMFMVGIELTKFVKDVRIGKDMISLSVTLIISISTNMAYGFLAGLAVHYFMQRALGTLINTSKNNPQ